MSNSNAKAGAKPGFGARVSRFFKGVKAEFKKIIWPDGATLGKQLAAVLITTVIVGVIIALLDFGFQNLIDLLTTLGAAQ